MGSYYPVMWGSIMRIPIKQPVQWKVGVVFFFSRGSIHLEVSTLLWLPVVTIGLSVCPCYQPGVRDRQGAGFGG